MSEETVPDLTKKQKLDLMKEAVKKIGEFSFRSSGSGGLNNQFQNFFTGIDKFKRNMLSPNSEHSGMTFITRPKLNLTSSALRQSSKMLALDTQDVSDVQFMIRCLLDTRFARKELLSKAGQSPLLDMRNPFNIPLCNALVGVSGWPDIVLETNTTEGGFHSEDQTVPIGSDNLNKTYDLTLTFEDIQGGVIASIFDFWLESMRCLVKGIMIPYKEDIDENRLCFTVSIYRFVLDPTLKYVVKYAKATGCYPISLPTGGFFNVNENEVTKADCAKFSIPFKVNKIEYNKPEVLRDFNTLVERYSPREATEDTMEASISLLNATNIIPIAPQWNWIGVPYIYTSEKERGIQLQYRQLRTEEERDIEDGL